jgi:hypothetical protein
MHNVFFFNFDFNYQYNRKMNSIIFVFIQIVMNHTNEEKKIEMKLVENLYLKTFCLFILIFKYL